MDRSLRNRVRAADAVALAENGRSDLSKQQLRRVSAWVGWRAPR